MLRLTLEVVPFGDEKLKHEIGVLEIANIGGTREFGEYRTQLFEPQQEEGITRFLSRYRRSQGAWLLVSKALRKYSKLWTER